MVQRCTNCKDQAFVHYGARGITVCDRWLPPHYGGHGSFENFLEDLGECPPGYVIDRIDVNGNYEPSNVQWLPKELSQRNRRNMKLDMEQVGEILFEVNFRGRPQREVAKRFDVTQGTVSAIARRKRWRYPKPPGIVEMDEVG